MRRILLSLAIVLGLVAMSACGDDDAASDDRPSDGDTESDAATGDAAFPVTLTGALGEVTIEEAPERVLPLTGADLDAVVGLGVEPIAVPTDDAGQRIDYPWLSEEITSIGQQLDVNAASGLPLEVIAGLEPDVIVANGYWDLPDHYDQLSQIAPVVHYTLGQNADGWEDTTRTIGQALGRSDEAEALVAETTAAVADQAAANPSLAGSSFNLLIARDAQNVSILRTEVDAMGRQLASLGLELTDFATGIEGADSKVPLSSELLPEVDADVVFVVGPPGVEDTLGASTLWSDIPAVARGSVVYLTRGDPDALALGFPTAINVAWLTDEIAPRITAAAEA